MLELLTPEQVTEMLQLRKTHLRRLRYQGEGPRYINMRGVIRYRPKDVEEWIDNCVVDPREPAYELDEPVEPDVTLVANLEESA